MYTKSYPNHSLFRLNLETGEIEKIEKTGIEKGFLYTFALNMVNAKKKFEKMIDYALLNHKP